MNLRIKFLAFLILLVGLATSCRYDHIACSTEYCDKQNPQRRLVFYDTLTTEPHFMVEYKYNAQGKVIQLESFEMPKRVLIFRLVSNYNNAGQLIEEQRFSENGQGSATSRPPFVFVGNTVYSYQNELLIMQKSFNLSREQTSYYTYAYDSLSRLKTVFSFLRTATKPNRGWSYDYNNLGQIVLEKQLNGDSTVSTSLKKIYRGNLLIKTQTLDKQGVVFTQNDFIYDALGNLLETQSNGLVTSRSTYCSCNLTQQIVFDLAWGGGIGSVTRYEY